MTEQQSTTHSQQFCQCQLLTLQFNFQQLCKTQT